jgi:bifunctional non-homologous end joining protein LigD
MLATSITTLPSGPGWAFEFKWDGVRALIDVSDAGVRIWSRAGNEITKAYPELVAQLGDVGDALLDGEIVAFVDGRPSFDALQQRMHVRSAPDARRLAAELPVTFVPFDVVRRFGVDLTARPYAERRATLERWAADRTDVSLSPAFDDGPATEAAARQHQLEGVVAKRLDSVYRPGLRSRDWQKLRFARSGDFVVVGWEGSAEHPNELSSLVLACYAGGVLTFAGKAGSGLTNASSKRLQGMLVEVTSCSLDVVPPASPGRRFVHWVRPDVVVEIEFATWTDERRLRHPVVRGIRPDKRPTEAVCDA